MQNTHRTTQLFGRAALVALLVAPLTSVSAQYQRDDRDRLERSAPVDVRRDEELRRADAVLRENARRRDEERRLFTWRGTVDGDMRVYVRAANVESRVASGERPRRQPRVDRDRALPRREGTLRVQLLDGRGRVQVIQQPSARNNYTAIVRVMDVARGADGYRFVAHFDPAEGTRRDGRDGMSGSTRIEAVSGDRVLRWTGSVDRDVRITMRGSSVGYSTASGVQTSDVNSSALRSLPRRDGVVEVVLRQGRGAVQVIQQPSRFNDYTAIVRIVDSQGSRGYYDFDLVWR